MKNNKITLSEYQKLCRMTAVKFKKRAKGSPFGEKEIFTWGLGMAGEAGDVAGCIKKTYSHNDDQTKGIKENLGDTMWYIAMICNHFGWSLEDVLEENIKKLKKRYPKGTFTFKHARRNGKRKDWNER